jgi:hypothetical protein
LIGWVVNSALRFGLHADDVRAIIDSLAKDASAFGPYLAASLRGARARVDYESGVIDTDELLDVTSEEIAFAEQTGVSTSRSVAAYFIDGRVPWLEGDAIGLEAGRRRHVEIEQTLGTNVFLANLLAQWAVALAHVGESERALEAVARGREVMEPGDVSDLTYLDVGEALARARLGDLVAANRLLARARETAAGTDSVLDGDEVTHAEATVRLLEGDSDGARTLLEWLAETSERRGLRRAADRYCRDLEMLDGFS